MAATANEGPNVAWLASLSPWPSDGFGLERMRALLRAVGDPQDAFPAVHVVGTNGKSTATRQVEELLRGEGLSVGATISPHVTGWYERVRVNGGEADLEQALARVRSAAEALGATQFETITGAALKAFADAQVDAAVVEAGLGGRLDATNVLRSRVVLLTSVDFDHTDVLGDTLEGIASEKLAVVAPGTVVILPDDAYAHLVPEGAEIRHGGAIEAAEAFLGHPVEGGVEVALPGRLERRRGEIRDGAHNPAAARWLVERLPSDDYTIVASVLRDKDAAGILAELARVGSRLVATQSTSPRALAAAELAEVARASFPHVEVVPAPGAALRRAHALGEPVLVTGSLTLLADLAAGGDEPAEATA